MRNALEEKVAERLKNKGKQRMRPKMGKMDIDYSILHDAFFKYQDKPKMAHIGDMYYEGMCAALLHGFVHALQQLHAAPWMPSPGRMCKQCV